VVEQEAMVVQEAMVAMAVLVVTLGLLALTLQVVVLITSQVQTHTTLKSEGLMTVVALCAK
jgi:hypothetical protein